ncbi:alpha/beta hydrolase fold domain-containing protein [Streptomyces noursei]|uniref:alpha/beta hydrolase fold domain-containing protein n=1 Tax=Streptomyces noursei TaxID=1971 RepID=UPI0035DCEBDD
MLDPRIKECFLDGLNAAPPPEAMTPAALRAALEGMLTFCAPPPPIAQVVDGTTSEAARAVPFRVYHPKPGTPLPLVVYFHGGGWTAGGIAFMDPPLRALAVEAGVVVLSAGYRLAPEHPFPAGLHDAQAVTSWAFENAAALGADPARFVIAGDSAGAALAAVVALEARGSAVSIGHQLLINPAVDPRMNTASYREFATGYQNSASMMNLCWRTYLNRPDGPLDDVPWQAAPVFAPDLSDLPPASVLTVEYDPLRDEGEAFAARMATAGVPTTFVCCPGLIHCALHLDGVAPRAASLRQHAARALTTAFA